VKGTDHARGLSSAASESHMAIVVGVMDLFLTVFLGLAVEEVEHVKGLDLELSDQDLDFKLVLIGLRLTTVSQRSQLYCRRLNARRSPSLPLGQYVYKPGALIIVLQMEYIQLEQVKYDRRQKHYVVIDDL